MSDDDGGETHDDTEGLTAILMDKMMMMMMCRNVLCQGCREIWSGQTDSECGNSSGLIVSNT